MGSTKHEKSFVDFEQPYEQNIIGLRGIIYFGVGLFALIVVTFALMWALKNVMRDFAEENADPTHPLALSDKERLPPEPRLQTAPGFGVDSQNGRVNMELIAPQAEYRELRKQWDELILNGQKDPKTGTIITMPINKAKALLLEQNVKAKSGAEAEKVLKDSLKVVSDSSAGRLASEIRR